jgi:hypothetical protein
VALDIRGLELVPFNSRSLCLLFYSVNVGEGLHVVVGVTTENITIYFGIATGDRFELLPGLWAEEGVCSLLADPKVLNEQLHSEALDLAGVDVWRVLEKHSYLRIPAS